MHLSLLYNLALSTCSGKIQSIRKIFKMNFSNQRFPLSRNGNFYSISLLCITIPHYISNLQSDLRYRISNQRYKKQKKILIFHFWLTSWGPLFFSSFQTYIYFRSSINLIMTKMTFGGRRRKIIFLYNIYKKWYILMNNCF